MHKLDSLCQLSANFCAALMAFSGGHMRHSEFGMFQQRASEILLVVDAISKLSEWLASAQVRYNFLLWFYKNKFIRAN